MQQQPIILLKSGTEASKGPGLIVANINACEQLVQSIRTTLGPRGQDKLIQSYKGINITNDGATIMQLLNVVHPAARILVEISESQDAEIGDGTTSVVLLAGELLGEAKSFIEDGVNAQLIVAGYRKACRLALARSEQVAINLETKTEQERKELVMRVAETSLNSKLLSNHKKLFGAMCYEAVSRLDPAAMNKNMVGIKKVAGGSVEDSFLVDGVAFAKTFSYAGFENAPKKFDNGPKILLLQIELEIKAEKENAEIRVETAADYQKMIDSEWEIIYEKLDAIVNSGANIVLSRLAIGDLATQYLADRKVFCAGRVDELDMKRTSKACGGKILRTVSQIRPEDLGTCDSFEEIQIGKERFNVFRNAPTSELAQTSRAQSATIILRGGACQFIDEAERSLNDAIMTASRALSSSKLVAGGGALDTHLSCYLSREAEKIEGKQQLIIKAFARALDVIPRVLASNSGLDAIQVLNELRATHFASLEKDAAEDKASGDVSGSSANIDWVGVDCMGLNTPASDEALEKEEGVRSGVTNTLTASVLEPLGVKLNSYSAATEAACAILSIDELIKNPKSNPEPNGPGPRPVRR